MNAFQAYDHVGFDLDNTLFDQQTYEWPIFEEIAMKIEDLYGLTSQRYANALKALYLGGGKVQTFDKALLSCVPELPASWEGTMQSIILPLYRNFEPSSLTLFEHSLSLLECVKTAHKKLVLITNGSVAVQNMKIDKLGIRNYFDLILISDSYDPPKRKPDTTMFRDALAYFNVNPWEMIFIGDDMLSDGASEEVGIKFLDIKHIV